MLDKLMRRDGSKKISTKSVVALDIGTEFVKALIANINDKGDAEIIGVSRVAQELGAMKAGAVADIAAVVEACDQALTKAEQKAGVDARNAIIGIAGELVKGTTSLVKYQRVNSKNPMTIEEVESIVTRAQQRARDEAKRQLVLETGNEHLEIRLVNSALVSIEVDGYSVTNPVGFQGREVTVQIYTAFAPMIHIGALERIAQELDLDLVAIAAEPFAVARSMVGSEDNNSFSSVLIDVGGGTTDIAVVRDGGVEGTKMFGIGGRAFTRTIANDLSIEFEEAEKLKLALNDSKLTDKEEENVLEAVEKTLKVWLSGVELALDEFKSIEHLPNQILLCGGGASLAQVVGALSGSEWYRQLPFTKKPKIHYISPTQVVGVVDKTATIEDHTFITAMGLIRVGIDSLTENTDKETSWRSRIDRLLAI